MHGVVGHGARSWMRWSVLAVTLTCVLVSSAVAAPPRKLGPHIKVTVGEGETLADIAGRYLGDRGQWKILQQVNQIKDLNTVVAGMELVVPAQASGRLAVAPRGALGRAYNEVFQRWGAQGEWRPAVRGALMFPGSQVRVDPQSRATVRLLRSVTVLLDERSVLRLTVGNANPSEAAPEMARLDRGRATIITGRFAARILTPSGYVRVDPQSLVRLSVLPYGKAVSAYTVRGAAWLNSAGTTASVPVGKASTAPDNKIPRLALDVVDAPSWGGRERFDALAVGDAGPLELTWEPVASAVSYRLEVARDRGFNAVVFDGRFSEPRANVELPYGELHARVTAVDGNNILGGVSAPRPVWVGFVRILSPVGQAEIVREGGVVRVSAPGALEVRPPLNDRGLEIRGANGQAQPWPERIRLHAGESKTIEWMRRGSVSGRIEFTVRPVRVTVLDAVVEKERTEVLFEVLDGDKRMPFPGRVLTRIGDQVGELARVRGTRYLHNGPTVADNERLTIESEWFGTLEVVYQPRMGRCRSIEDFGTGCRL